MPVEVRIFSWAHNICDSVAQLVEHLPFKERVLGSSPSGITKSFSFLELFFYSFIFDFLKVLVLKSGLKLRDNLLKAIHNF